MRFRKLRIAWSVVWGIATVLLCVLWLRTHAEEDGLTIYVPKHRIVCISSHHGVLDIYVTLIADYEVHADIHHGSDGYWGRFSYWELQFRTDDIGRPQVFVRFPHAFAAPLTSALAILPWLPRRFSLRVLLIATTLVAIGLGLIVSSAKKVDPLTPHSQPLKNSDLF